MDMLMMRAFEKSMKKPPTTGTMRKL